MFKKGERYAYILNAGPSDIEGRVPVDFIILRISSTSQGDAPIRVPIIVSRHPNGKTVRVEAAGFGAGPGPTPLFAETRLAPGDYRLASIGGRPVGRRFRVGADGAPLTLFCPHPGTIPSVQETRSLFLRTGELLAAWSRYRVGRCCSLAESRRVHDSLIVLAPFQGSLRRAVNKTSVSVSPEEWLAVSPGILLEPGSTQEYPVAFRSLNITSAALKAFFNEAGLVRERDAPAFPHVPFSPSATLVRALSDLESALCPSTALGAGLEARIALHRFLLVLFREQASDPTGKSRLAAGVAPERPDPRLLKAMEYLRAHYGEPCPVGVIARHAAVSISVLGRLFRKHLGTGPNDYLQGIRIEVAKKLLQDRTVKLADIAEEVGYLDVRSFRRVFKAHASRQLKSFRPG